MLFVRCSLNFFIILISWKGTEIAEVCWPFLRRMRVTIPNTQVQREKQAVAGGLEIKF